ncbi:hypothetical protein OSB04_001794 [Centaurea solstitialis]|uniref:Aminotransferase-like plant mobile domain-containing protein n=1 Tax=Centaurea solstitialis TaxID=347529 RepID=A0AA38TRM7_9ASTR|nr:hypothetical protein OSB04_001794 [Centaurea solstitialis]
MENMTIHPGPFNKELLFLETSHRAYNMFYGDSNPEETLDLRRGDRELWKHIKAGFEGVFNCGFKPLDHSLITALVERWRPETHTFHLPIGEVTVTLQDVHLMWDLRIDGEVVTGCQRTWSLAEKIETCYRLLGIETEQGNFRGAQLKMPFLRTVLETTLSDNATNEQCMQRARAYILLLLGGSIFPDGADNSVHMNLLVLLEDFDRCGGLSWGSAALACLYRNLCKGATNDKIIAGPLMLLQLWAWSRIRATGPKYDGHALQRPFVCVFMAIESIYGSWASNFEVLPRYIHALETSNPNTVVVWSHDPNSSSNIKTFKYVFWAFGPAIEAFAYCIPVICVDGTHLKGSYKGKLLTAVTKDANNHILPLAYAIVDEETQLRWYVANNNSRELCVISDRHKGILNAMSTLDEWKEPIAYH